MNALAKAGERRTTLREIAEATGAAYRTVAAYAQKAGWTRNGARTFLTEEQATIIIEAMKASSTGGAMHTKAGGETLRNVVQGVETTQSRAVRIAVMAQRQQELSKQIQAEMQSEITELRTLNNQQQKLIEEQAPKALFADAVAASDGTILVGELAKILRGNGIEIGQNRLFEQLRQWGYLISRKGTDRNMPTQRAMEMGLFRIKETAITHSDGHVSITKTVKVSGRGQLYFTNMFLAALPTPVHVGPTTMQ